MSSPVELLPHPEREITSADPAGAYADTHNKDAIHVSVVGPLRPLLQDYADAVSELIGQRYRVRAKAPTRITSPGVTVVTVEPERDGLLDSSSF